MYIVNWYPGSYGDRIIKDLFDIEYSVTDNDVYRLPYNAILKYPETYQLDFETLFDTFQTVVKHQINTYGVIGAHRLNRLDFTKFLPDVKVISIDPGKNIDSVVNSFFKKVQGLRPEHDNPIIKYLLNKHQTSSAKLYKNKLITDWKRDNILEHDIIFDLDRYIQDSTYTQWFKTNALS